jgi:hypothetical protein
VSFIFEIKRFRYISFYNLAWTSFPLIIKALFDKDFYYKKWTGVGDEKAGKISEEYKDNLKTPSKNPDSSPEGIPRPPSRTPGRDFPKNMERRDSDFSGGGTDRHKLARQIKGVSFSDKINSQTQTRETELKPKDQTEAQNESSAAGQPPKGCLTRIKNIFVCKRPGNFFT